MSTESIELGDWSVVPTAIDEEIIAIGETAPPLENISNLIDADVTTVAGGSIKCTSDTVLNLGDPTAALFMSSFSQIGEEESPTEFRSPFNQYSLDPDQAQIYGYVNLKSTDLDAVIESIEAHDFESTIRETIVGKLYENALAGDNAETIENLLTEVDEQLTTAQENLAHPTSFLTSLWRAKTQFRSTQEGKSRLSSYKKGKTILGNPLPSLNKSVPELLSTFTDLPRDFFEPKHDVSWSLSRNYLQALYDAQMSLTTGVSTIFLYNNSPFKRGDNLKNVEGRYPVQTRDGVVPLSLNAMGGASYSSDLFPVINNNGKILSNGRLYENLQSITSKVAQMPKMSRLMYYICILTREARLSAGLSQLAEDPAAGSSVYVYSQRTATNGTQMGAHQTIENMLGTQGLTGIYDGADLINAMKNAPPISLANLTLSKMTGATFNNPEESRESFLTVLDANSAAFGGKVKNNPETFIDSFVDGPQNIYSKYHDIINRSMTRSDDILDFYKQILPKFDESAVLSLGWGSVTTSTYLMITLWNSMRDLVSELTEIKNSREDLTIENKKLMAELIFVKIYATTNQNDFKRQLLYHAITSVSSDLNGGTNDAHTTKATYPRFGADIKGTLYGPALSDTLEQYFAFPGGPDTGETGGCAHLVAGLINVLRDKKVESSDEDHICTLTYSDLIELMIPTKVDAPGWSTAVKGPFSLIKGLLFMIMNGAGGISANNSGPEDASNAGQLISALAGGGNVTRFSEMDSSTMAAILLEAVSIVVDAIFDISIASNFKDSKSLGSGGKFSFNETVQNLYKFRDQENFQIVMPASSFEVNGKLWRLSAVLTTMIGETNISKLIAGNPDGLGGFNVDGADYYGAMIIDYEGQRIALDGYTDLSVDPGIVTPAILKNMMLELSSEENVTSHLLACAYSYIKYIESNDRQAKKLLDAFQNPDDPLTIFSQTPRGKQFFELISANQLVSASKRLEALSLAGEKKSLKISHVNSYVRSSQKFLFEYLKTKGADVFDENPNTALGFEVAGKIVHRNLDFVNGAILFAAAPSIIHRGNGATSLYNKFVKVEVRRQDQMRPFINPGLQNRELYYPQDYTVTPAGITQAFEPEEDSLFPPKTFLELVELAYYKRGDELTRGIDLIKASNIMTNVNWTSGYQTGKQSSEDSMRSRLANLMADYLLKTYYEERLVMSFSEEDVQTDPYDQRKFSPKVLDILKIMGGLMGIPESTIKGLFPVEEGSVYIPSKHSKSYQNAVTPTPKIIFNDFGEGLKAWDKPLISEVDVQILTDFFNTKPFMINKVHDHVFTPSLFDKIYASFCPLDNFLVVPDFIPKKDNMDGAVQLARSVSGTPGLDKDDVIFDIVKRYSFDKTGTLYQSKANIDQFSVSISEYDPNDPFPAPSPAWKAAAETAAESSTDDQSGSDVITL